jgi:hypothetical protein
MATSAEPAQQTASTGQVARALCVSKSTLIRWVKLGFLPEPELVLAGSVRLRIWRKEDYERALNHRQQYYWWTRDEIERRKHDDGKQPGTERPAGDDQAGGAAPSEDSRP